MIDCCGLINAGFKEYAGGDDDALVGEDMDVVEEEEGEEEVY